MEHTELTFVPTKDLLEEIHRRHVCCVFAGCLHTEDGCVVDAFAKGTPQRMDSIEALAKETIEKQQAAWLKANPWYRPK